MRIGRVVGKVVLSGQHPSLVGGQFKIVVPLTFIFPRVGFGVFGVFGAEPVSNFIGGAACFLTMMATVWPELTRGEREMERMESE